MTLDRDQRNNRRGVGRGGGMTVREELGKSRNVQGQTFFRKVALLKREGDFRSVLLDMLAGCRAFVM